MEVHGVLKIFECSETLREVWYVNYLGGGEARCLNKVDETKVYGMNVEIEEL